MRRRTHTKSRLGCKECKLRKIKCDEKHPSCFNCSRHGIACSFGEPPAPSPEQARPASYGEVTESAPSVASTTSPLAEHVAAQEANRLTTSRQPELSYTTPTLTLTLDPSRSAGLDESWTRDLELMHHYCTVTCATLALNESARHVWRILYPQEGYTHALVMHGILSISALHKAYLLPNQQQKYLARSAYHQNLGQEKFRPLLASVTGDNWRSVFCFASIVVLYVCCLPLRNEDPSTAAPIRNTLELFSVVRGIKAFLMPFLEQILQTDLAPLVHSAWIATIDLGPGQDKPSLAYSSLPEDTYDVLARLLSFFKEERGIENIASYEEAIVTLDVAAARIATAGVNVELGAILLWAFIVSENVIDDIRQRKPHALVLLSHYAVFLGAMDRTYWFLEGWGHRLVEDIDEYLSREPTFKAWLAWPKAHVRP
ncbi:C6 zinc finger domain-containing protein [Xylariales sp. PMI_506]|nr:C6 zinc finger domain-containing protein [Xylariales sp. PMI_506]